MRLFLWEPAVHSVMYCTFRRAATTITHLTWEGKLQIILAAESAEQKSIGFDESIPTDWSRSNPEASTTRVELSPARSQTSACGLKASSHEHFNLLLCSFSRYTCYWTQGNPTRVVDIAGRERLQPMEIGCGNRLIIGRISRLKIVMIGHPGVFSCNVATTVYIKVSTTQSEVTTEWHRKQLGSDYVNEVLTLRQWKKRVCRLLNSHRSLLSDSCLVTT